jgi:hypothetical protein
MATFEVDSCEFPTGRKLEQIYFHNFRRVGILPAYFCGSGTLSRASRRDPDTSGQAAHATFAFSLLCVTPKSGVDMF